MRDYYFIALSEFILLSCRSPKEAWDRIEGQTGASNQEQVYFLPNYSQQIQRLYLIDYYFVVYEII